MGHSGYRAIIFYAHSDAIGHRRCDSSSQVILEILLYRAFGQCCAREDLAMATSSLKQTTSPSRTARSARARYCSTTARDGEIVCVRSDSKSVEMLNGRPKSRAPLTAL